MILFAPLKPTPRTTLTTMVLTVALCCFPVLAQSGSNDSVLQAYLDRVAELNRDGRALVQEHGKVYLIGEYQALMETHPEYEKNIQLETRIGEIYEWDYSNRGEPPDIESAYAVYLGIVDRYNPDYEYTKLVYRRAADRAEQFDLDAARELYSGMMQTYPDDPVIQLESMYRLGAIAEQSGDFDQAQELFGRVLNYDATNPTLNPDEAERIETLQAQAASLLMALATDTAATPEERLAALDSFLNDNPGLTGEHGEIADSIRTALNRLKDSSPRDEIREAMDDLQSMLAERQQARSRIDSPSGRDTDVRTASANANPETNPQMLDSVSSPTAATTVSAPGMTVDGAATPRAFEGLEPDLDGKTRRDSVDSANNRAAAMAAATVCVLLAAAGVFALRKRF